MCFLWQQILCIYLSLRHDRYFIAPCQVGGLYLMGRTFVFFCVKAFQICRALWGLGLAHRVTHYTSQPCCVQSTCWQRQHSSISSALGLHIRDASDHPAGQLCLVRVILGIRHHGAQQYLQGFMPLSEVLGSGRSASRHFVWSDSPGNTNCCVKFYTLGQLRCLSSRQAKSYEAWLGKSFLHSLLLWYLPQTGAIHWDISATRTARSSQPCCQDSYLTTW